jgi:UDP-glucose 4-epimerase
VHGDGEQSRDFTYVANVIDATVLAMTAPSAAVRPGLFNVASGGRVTVNELVRALAEILGAPAAARHGDPRPGDIKHSQADIARIRERLGFEPRVSFADGLARTVEHFRNAGETA